MHQNDWIMLQLARERERDMLGQLQYRRLVREAQSLPHERRHRLYHVLDWIGQYLIRWGEWLQAQHAAYHASLNTSQELYHG